MTQHLDGIDIEAGDQPQTTTYPSFLRLAWRRKTLLLLGVVVGMILALFNYVQRKPVYESSAKVLVTPRTVAGGSPNLIDPSLLEDYLSTHMELIKSPLIVREAVAKLKQNEEKQKQTAGPSEAAGEDNRKRTLLTLDNRGDPVAIISSGLTITRGARGPDGRTSNILNVSFRGPEGEDCPIILDAVLHSFRDYLYKPYQNVNDQVKGIFNEWKTEVDQKLQQEKSAREKHRKQHQNLKVGNIYQDQLAKVYTDLQSLQRRDKEISALLKVIQKAKTEGTGQSELADQLGKFMRNTPNVVADKKPPLNDQVTQLVLEDKLLENEGIGPSHARRQAVQQKIALLQQMLGNGQSFNTPTGNILDGYEKSLKKELEINEGLEKTLTDDLVEAKKLVNDQSDFQYKDQEMEKSISNTENLHKEIEDRLKSVNLVKLTGGYEGQVVSEPSASVQVEPKILPIAAVGLLLGLVGGFGLVYLAEITDKSFRTPEEIRKRLGMAVVGQIPMFKSDDEASHRAESDPATPDPMLCTFYRSKSIEAEAYRGVRTSLYFSTHGEGHKVIQVTSPVVGDGKTTLAANLAVSIAQSGKRTILIDADFRRPRIHKIFGVSGKVGLATVIAGEANLEEAIQQCEIPGLSILPAGKPPPNPAELLTAPRFKELLDQIRDQFDFVLVDTPPLLVVTDPCVVAPRVDGVLLTIRITKNGRPQAERAREILSNLRANVFGVVVNAVSSKGRGGVYGYETYKYGYYQGGYGYDSYYSDKDAKGDSKDVQKDVGTIIWKDKKDEDRLDDVDDLPTTT